ncbi:hypothetical protein ABT56_09825 [Photobacterium aquae]|uniref:Sulfotransferase domain-containing protein n=1 Tax=Photobacterium aquae TaxID=1195763 RepID=A0A0J1H1Z3_9GAMM|nr:sulfotransferase [Photobacterium aquae]KLV05830.1 hypothetical protein ABT56_09825 [Photobacterium aquae]
MKRVNLFIVGGQKCGTTALASFLQQHPDICLVDGKEAHIFDFMPVEQRCEQTLDQAYGQLTSHYQGERYLCDATPIYSYWQDIHGDLVEYSPDAKIIFMLRDPVERAVSQYQMEYGRGTEDKGIIEAFISESYRLKRAQGDRSQHSSWRLHSYIDRGFFSHQYDNLLKHFAPEQILLIHNQSLRKYHDKTLEKVFDFLELPNCKIPEKTVFSGKYSETGPTVKLAKLIAHWRLHQEREFVKQFEIID